MKIAILESIVMPAGHEVEFDRILVEELKKQGHEPVFLCLKPFLSKLITMCRRSILMAEKLFPMLDREN